MISWGSHFSSENIFKKICEVLISFNLWIHSCFTFFTFNYQTSDHHRTETIFNAKKFTFSRTIELCSEENPNRLMAGPGASTRMSMKAKVRTYLQKNKKLSFRYQRWSNFGVLKRRLPTSIERSLHLQLLTMQLFLLDEIDNFTRPTIISGRVHTSPSTKLQQHDSIDDSHRK